ncbi:MAG: hypothetical protein AAGC73_07180 [Verrucomicrobiota bacterium]
MTFRALLLFALSLLSGALHSMEQWSSGSFAILEVRGSIQLISIGKTQKLSGAGEFPTYENGLLKIEAKEVATVYAYGSNGLTFKYNGPGFFVVERFEQNTDALETGLRAKTRSIFSLRNGRLTMDDRDTIGESSLVLETPLGRLSGAGAFWAIEIEYDESSQRYRFQIECAEGLVRFTDLNGKVYLLRTRQRLSGAGSSGTPSIEAAEFTNDEEEVFELFDTAMSGYKAVELSTAALQSKMRILERESQGSSKARFKAERRRPVLIEFEPAPQPLTPFRGEIRPPSEYEADIF